MLASPTRSPRLRTSARNGGSLARENRMIRSGAWICRPSEACSGMNTEAAAQACGLQATG